MNRVILCLLTAVLFTACRSHKTKQEWLAADEAGLQERLQSAHVRYYRFFKLGFRAGADTASGTYRVYRAALGPAYPWRLRDSVEPQPAAQRAGDAASYGHLYQRFSSLRAALDTGSEDRLPPLCVALTITEPNAGAGLPPLQDLVALEHTVLSIASFKIPELGREVALYEASLPDPATLPNDEVATLAGLYQGFLLHANEFFYLSEARLHSSLQRFNQHGDAPMPLLASFLSDRNVTPAQTVAGIRAMHHLLLALNHRRMHSEEDRAAVDEDLAHFEQEAAKADMPPYLLSLVRQYRKNPEAMERALIAYALERYAAIEAGRLRGMPALAPVHRVVAHIRTAFHHSESFLSKEALLKKAAAVKDKGGALWDKAKEAVR